MSFCTNCGYYSQQTSKACPQCGKSFVNKNTQQKTTITKSVTLQTNLEKLRKKIFSNWKIGVLVLGVLTLIIYIYLQPTASPVLEQDVLEKNITDNDTIEEIIEKHKLDYPSVCDLTKFQEQLAAIPPTKLMFGTYQAKYFTVINTFLKLPPKPVCLISLEYNHPNQKDKTTYFLFAENSTDVICQEVSAEAFALCVKKYNSY